MSEESGRGDPVDVIDQEDVTTTERQDSELASIRTFVTTVVRTEQVTPSVRQLTFGGGDLAAFTRPAHAVCDAAHVRVSSFQWCSTRRR